MNWAEFRSSHLLKNGPSTREQLSSDYAKYKKTLPKSNNLSRSPPRLPSRSPTRSVNNLNRSPTRSVNNLSRSPSRLNTLARSPPKSLNSAYTRSYNTLNNSGTNKLSNSYVNINTGANTKPTMNTRPSTFNTLSKSNTAFDTRKTFNNVPKSPIKSTKVPVTSPIKSATKLPSNVPTKSTKMAVVPAKAAKSSLLSMKDFDTMAKGKEFLIVVLYADWCGHCQNMKTKLGNKMKNTDTIKFYNEKTLSEDVKDYYPKVLYYENGDRRKDLTVDAVFDYLD